MIRVDRGMVDEGGNTIEPRDGWLQAAATETQKAEDDGPIHQVSDLYRDARVKATLEKLFWDKCAYCESPGFAGFDWDVEHFRPKGRVAEDENHPGYYWLTYTWTNLYASCVYCNQRRKDRPRWDDPTTGAAAGKLDQFPVDPAATRVSLPGDDLTGEGRLLLDPCEDDPEEHISFTPKGSAVALNQSVKGKTSIKVFVLNRKRLRDARLMRIRLIIELIDELADTLGADDAQRSEIITTTLDKFSEPHLPYAGVVRAIRRQPDGFGL